VDRNRYESFDIFFNKLKKYLMLFRKANQ
jgi:hypothetical protein